MNDPAVPAAKERKEQCDFLGGAETRTKLHSRRSSKLLPLRLQRLPPQLKFADAVHTLDSKWNKMK